MRSLCCLVESINDNEVVQGSVWLGTVAWGLLPRSTKKILHLGDDFMIDCMKFDGSMQGVCIRFAFTSKLIGRMRVWACVL
jgi:hypothetical protein